MRKKIKDLDELELKEICSSYGEVCSDKCPLYRIGKNRRRLCFIITYKVRPSLKEKEKMEEYIEWKTNYNM